MAENNKSILTLTFKLIIFLLFIGLILVIFILPYAPKTGIERRYVFELNKLNDNTNVFDFALFGNSYVYTAYDPTILRAKLGLNAIHINSSSQILETSLILAEDLIEKNNFKYVLFDVSENSVLRPEIQKEKSWYFQTIALQEVPFSFNKLRKVNNFFPKKEYNEYYFSSISEKSGKLFRLNKRKDYLFKNRQTNYYHFKDALFSENGYFAYDYRVKSLDKKVFDKVYNEKAKKKINSDTLWNYDLKHSMIDVIERAQSKNIQVILVNSLKLRRENFNRKFIDSLTNTYGNVKFLNFNDKRADYNLNKNSFFDTSHLTYLGSHQVTHTLVDSISKWFKIPQKDENTYDFKYLNLVDYAYNLNNDQDKYIKLEFDSIPSHLKNHKLVVYLYPKDSTLLSKNSKNKNFKSDNFYINLDKSSGMNLKDSYIFIERIKTNISEKSLDKIKVFFYKSNDTLKLSSFNISP
tara:strand:- start:1621 stop:3015 length:1395 start_codon:yes stop_codon:yes gene_type:complete